MGTVDLSKKTFLSVYISYDCVYANFVNLSSNRQSLEIYKDKSVLSYNIAEFSSNVMLEFWMSYFKSLERKWGIQFLEKPKFSNGRIVLNLKVNCKVGILRSNPSYKKIFSSLREFSLDIKPYASDTTFEKDLLTDLAIFLDYDDVILLDLNSRFFKISRVEKEEGDLKGSLDKVKLPSYRFVSEKNKWEDLPVLLELLNGPKYKTFLSKHLSSNFLSNIWGNFLLKPVLETNSVLLKDFIRSYITIQLLALCSDSSKLNKDFGVKPYNNLLWLTGDLINLTSFKELLLSVIDGLELRGTFDVALDKSGLIHTLGRTFCLGEKSDDIELTSESFLPSFTKVFAPDLDLKPDVRKVIFSGTLFDTKDKSIDVFATSSELTEINIKNPKTTYLEGAFIKRAYIEGYTKPFDLRCSMEEIIWEKILFDCRVKPVIYGPDVKANSIKFNMWLSGESYS